MNCVACEDKPKYPNSPCAVCGKEDECMIELELDDETFIRLSLLAHERNITLNQLVNNILSERIKNESTGE